MWVLLTHLVPGLMLLWWLPVYTRRMDALTPVYAMSRIFNCVTGGKCSWTFSARVGEAVMLRRAPVRVWDQIEIGINWVFQDDNHCAGQARDFGAKVIPDKDSHEFETSYSYTTRLIK